MTQLTTPGQFCEVETPVTGQTGPSKYWAPSMRITNTPTTFWFPTLSLQVWGARFYALRQVMGALGASPPPPRDSRVSREQGLTLETGLKENIYAGKGAA